MIPSSEELPLTPGEAKALLANLHGGLRAALFLPLAPTHVKPSWTQLLVLTALDVILQLATDRLMVGPGGEFVAAGLSGALFGFPVIVCAAWAMARLAKGVDQTLALAVVFSAIALVLDGAYCAAALLAQREVLPPTLRLAFDAFGFYTSLGWLVLAAGVAATRWCGFAAARRLAALLLSLALLGLPLSQVPRNTTLWSLPFDIAAAHGEAQHSVFETEQAIYLQPQLLERALGALKPGRAGVIDLYFVGAAGYAREDVFMNEVQAVGALFKQRFGTDGRSVLLINNQQTALELPMASATSLAHTLQRIGAVMNRGEDILFLFLTSHGSTDHKLALDFGGIRFDDLDPARLRQILDASGIKRRVVVISACYSGGFVDALKNEDSLIITAASTDKYSFGCGNENAFTYFGQAYFDEALRQTSSFIAAFDIAKPVIAEREKAQHFTSSDPQMFVGDKIRQPLEQLQMQQQRLGTKQ